MVTIGSIVIRVDDVRDLYTDDQAGEVKRLIGLGATEVHWDKRPPDADYVILADPEGNRFCVIDTTR